MGILPPEKGGLKKDALRKRNTKPVPKVVVPKTTPSPTKAMRAMKASKTLTTSDAKNGSKNFGWSKHYGARMKLKHDQPRGSAGLVVRVGDRWKSVVSCTRKMLGPRKSCAGAECGKCYYCVTIMILENSSTMDLSKEVSIALRDALIS